MPLQVWVDQVRLEVVENAAARFEAATGVPTEVRLVGFGDIRQQLLEQAPLGEGPDIFIGLHDWLGELAVHDIVEPVDLGVREADFFGVAIDAFSYDGATYGVPYAMEAIGLYRNVDLAPEAPESFEDLIAVCEALGDTVTQCLTAPAGGDFYHHHAFLASEGGYVFAFEDRRYDVSDIGIDSAGAVAGFEFLSGLVADGTLDPAVDYGVMTDLFYGGDAAFMWTGPWELPNVQAAGIDYAVSKLPTIEGNTAVPFVDVQGFMVSAFSGRKTEATEFLLDFIATEDVMVALYESGRRSPAHIGALGRLDADADVQAFGGSAAEGRPMPNILEMAGVWGSLGNAVQEIYSQTSDAATALGFAQAEVEAALAE
jgi:maltose-binding protein MalE